MREFFRTSSFRVLVISVVVLLGLIIYTASVGSSFLGSIFGFVSTPMQGISAEMSENISDVVDLDGLSEKELKDMVEALRDQVASLQEQVVGYHDLEQENAQLKVQLGIMDDESTPEIVSRAASVIGRDPNDPFYGFSIDCGTLSGVSVGDPVITSRGLVGVVSQAYATTSRVTCILSEDIKVAAMSKERDESGVVVSDVRCAASGFVKLMYLSGETQIQPGDIITTTGVGSTYPENLIIGVVESVEQSLTDISKYAIVRPYDDLKEVRDVFVVTDFPGKGEETGVEYVEDEPGTQNMEDPEDAQ